MFSPRLLVTLLLCLAITAGAYPMSVATPATALAQETDTEPPVIQQMSDQTYAAIDASGVVVSYQLPAISDDTDANPSLSCSPSPGSLFPLGATRVTCESVDASNNRSEMSFAISVTDQTAPGITQPSNVAITAPDSDGAAVDFPLPSASDNVDGLVPVWCDLSPGSSFPVGETWVTCSASDAAGNLTSVTFVVTIFPPVIPTVTLTPVPTVQPSSTPPETQTPATREPSTTASETATATGTPRANATETASATKTPVTPTPAALVLTASAPNFVLITNGGPLGLLASIWGDWPASISQEFGYTAFSISHSRWYTYGRSYGLDGLQHPGIDIAIPAGTPLYSPVSGTVKVAGGQPFFTFYGNGLPGVGELLIQTDSGDQVILGHMGLITVRVGDRIEIGQFVGLSGGYNGDHLHLETRSLQAGNWYLAVDPRKSFIVQELELAAADLVKKQRAPGRSLPHFPSTAG